MRFLSSHRRVRGGLLFLGFCLLLTGAVVASDDSDSPDDAKPGNTDETKIEGVFEAVKAEEISADTERIESFRIKQIVPHGTKVSAGQNIVSFETKEIDKKINEAEIEQRLAKLNLDDAEFSHQQLLETQSLDKASAQQARENAQQDYDNFVQIDRDRQQLSAEFNLKISRAALENVTEELEQLEQMYKEDDLTEQSEEIVLKRAKQAVESAQFRLDGAQISSQRTIEQTIPRSTTQQEESLARAQLAYKKSIQDLESARRKSELELSRTRDKLKEQEEHLAELRQERKRTALASPIDGIVLHGKLNRGKVGEKPTDLKAGSKVSATQVVATVVNPDKLQIRVDLEEQYLANVTKGAKCKVTPKGFPELELDADVKSVSVVPYAGTKFDCIVSFRQTERHPEILPSMTCELKFQTGEQTSDQTDEVKEPVNDKPN